VSTGQSSGEKGQSTALKHSPTLKETSNSHGAPRCHNWGAGDSEILFGRHPMGPP